MNRESTEEELDFFQEYWLRPESRQQMREVERAMDAMEHAMDRMAELNVPLLVIRDHATKHIATLDGEGYSVQPAWVDGDNGDEGERTEMEGAA